MKILYAAMRHDYGRPEQGPSFEHHTFFDTLRRLGHDLLYFDFMELARRQDPSAVGRRLEAVAGAERQDLLFAVLFKDEIDPDAIARISRAGRTPTLNWFCDDHWRFEDFSRRYAPAFDWVVTTARSAVPKYEAIGYRHAIKSQWAANHLLYQPPPDAREAHDVTFVGQPHGDRREVVRALEEAGIPVAAWGAGWERGRLEQEAMIRTFAESRVNLNLANASVAAGGGTPVRRSPVRRAAGSLLAAVPGGPSIKAWLRGAMPRPAPASAAPSGRRYFEQIKARNFEIPACGGFVLTGRAEDIEAYYAPGQEVEVFDTTGELVEKARHYLEHDDERRAIAAAGRRRTLAEHTYVHRFDDVFARMGLERPPLAQALAGTIPPGSVRDVA